MKELRPESLSPEQLEKLKEAVDERKKLIQSLRGKPWPMKKKLVTLRYFDFLVINIGSSNDQIPLNSQLQFQV